MSTEKSCLLRDSVGKLKEAKQVAAEYDGLIVPIGITVNGFSKGRYDFLTLEDKEKSSHILLCGVPGSGVAVTVNTCILSTMLIYGEDVKISYVDGTGNEVGRWLKDGECILPNHGFVGGTTTVDDFTNAVDSIILTLEKKADFEPELIVLADTWLLIRKLGVSACSKIMYLFKLAGLKNAHIIFTAQKDLEKLYDYGSSRPYSIVCEELLQWDFTALTRVSEDVAGRLHGVTDAWHDLLNGKLFVKYRLEDTVAEYDVPYSDDEDVRDFSMLSIEIDS